MKSTFLFFLLFVSMQVVSGQTHYIFFYAYADGDKYDDYYKEVVVTKIYKDDAKTHFLFKLFNLKERALAEMEKRKYDHQKFRYVNTNFSSTEEEANEKLEKLKEVWKRKNTIIHQINFEYQNATGKEIPDG